MEPLVKDLLTNKSEANFNRLYGVYNPGLYRIAIGFIGFDKALAEDVIQETWLTAIRKLDSFRGESSFKTWLTGILINKCHEGLRLSKSNGHSVVPHLNSLEMPTRIIDIDMALKSLAPGYREIVVLHDVEGYKHHEIAEMLGISEGTSKSQLFNARKILKEYLK